MQPMLLRLTLRELSANNKTPRPKGRGVSYTLQAAGSRQSSPPRERRIESKGIKKPLSIARAIKDCLLSIRKMPL